MSKKPDGTKSSGGSRRVRREYNSDYYQPSSMQTRAGRAERKRLIEGERLLGLTTRRRQLAKVNQDPNSGYRLTLKTLEFKQFIPDGVALRDFKLARAAAAKQAARRQGPRAR